MQESLLASRLPSYTRVQIGWECPSSLIAESGGDDLLALARNRPSVQLVAPEELKSIVTYVLVGDVSKLKSETIY